MLKKNLAIFLIIAAVLIFFQIAHNVVINSPQNISKKLKYQIERTKSPDVDHYNDWLWSKGRSFTYEIVFMNIFSPGTVVLSIKDEVIINEKQSYALEAKLIESNFFRRIYEAEMVINSYVDRASKCSMKYQEESKTPDESKTKVINFYPDDNYAEREGIKFKIPDNVYDPLSVFFKLLSSEFKIGEAVILKLLSKEEIYEFKITPENFKDGIYKLSGEVYREDRSSTHGAKFTIWVLNDEVRIPLLVKVISAAGPIYLRLKSVE